MPLLSVKHLVVELPSAAGPIRPVDDLSLDIDRGEIACIVGESGSGKSTTALALMRLLGDKARVSGNVMFRDIDLLQQSEKQMCSIRGNRISMVFQEPMTALNPVKTIGEQIMGPVLLHSTASRAEARDRASELLSRVGIDRVQERLQAYPHQLSGGQRQRVVIAMALACRPDLIVADEPTTALDTTVQRQILDLLQELVDETSVALLLITHNLAVVSEVADKVMVMYGGRLVEAGPVEAVLYSPLHPYTQGLLRALPTPHAPPGARLVPIAGNVPDLATMPSGCGFATRCPIAVPSCRDLRPEQRSVKEEHVVACPFA